MATVLITGGTGMIGKALTRALLQRHHEVIILSRKSPQPAHRAGVSYARWDLKAGQIDHAAIQRADFVVHLAGANIAEKRWTKKRKSEIVDSRTDSARLIVDALQKTRNNVKAVISASGCDYYPPDGQAFNTSPFTEKDGPDGSFLGETCVKWEASVAPISTMGKRLVIFRTAIVLGFAGGMLKELMRPLRFGLAVIFGNGRQVVSWIHLEDIVNLYVTAIEDETYSGVYNATSPSPITNRELVMSLARVKRRHFIPLRVPAIFLKLFLGEMSTALLKSCTVSAQKLIDTGYSFRRPTIETAITGEDVK